MIRFGEVAQQVRERAGDYQVPLKTGKALGHAYGGGSQFFSHVGRGARQAGVTLSVFGWWRRRGIAHSLRHCCRSPGGSGRTRSVDDAPPPLSRRAPSHAGLCFLRLGMMRATTALEVPARIARSKPTDQFST